MKKVLVVLGTRPEAIKLASIINALKKKSDQFAVTVCNSGQHQEMILPILKLFQIEPEVNLNVMKPGQSLTSVTCDILERLSPVLEKVRPDWILVQGDTTTTFAASLAGFYAKIRVGHIEAGLRTHNKFHPYPEETNRCLTSVLVDFHFAATEQAQKNLLQEGIPAEKIAVTGNTVIDALLTVLEEVRTKKKSHYLNQFSQLDSTKKLILVTSHRRESFGPVFERICQSLRQIVDESPDAEIIYPVHLNPAVREPARRFLSGHSRIHLIEPLDYEPFVYLMDRTYLILTDSGGIQEEAPSLGKPVLVMRDTTERPEGVKAGLVKVIGRKPEDIVRETQSLLKNRTLYDKMSHGKNPYGDGQATLRILNILAAS